MDIYNTVSPAGLEVPHTRAQVGYVGEKLGCASNPPVCSLLVWEDRMRTYPTWALVRGNFKASRRNCIYFCSIQNDNNSDQAENKYFLGCNNQYEHSCLPPVAGCMQLRPLRGGRGKKLEPGNKWWHDPNICHSHATIAQKLKWPMNMGTSDPWHIQRGLGEDTVMTSTSITPYSTIVSVLSFEYEHTEWRFFNIPLE